MFQTSFYRPSPFKAKVVEDVPRTANASYSYTGTVRTVGSGKTYATLTAAYSAAASGDIIEVYGTIDLTAEAGGYWLINTAKSVLVRGSTSNAADTVLVKNSGTSFAVRVRVNSGIVFKDLTIQTSQNLPLIYNDADEANRNMICDNVRFIQNNSSASAKWIDLSGANTTQTRYFEFKNCYFEKSTSGVSIPLNVSMPSPNNTLLFTGCNFSLIGNCIRVPIAYDGDFIMYDCNFTQNSSDVVILFGNDTTVPASTIGLLDFRGCVVKFAAGYVGDGFLVGRGTDNCLFYNNEIYINAISAAASCSLCIKTTSSVLGNSIFRGNFCFAPRPFYIKGGSSTVVSDNIFVSNFDVYEPFGFANHKIGADEVLSRYNVVTNNVFVSKNNYPIRCYNDATAEAPDVSFKTCTLNNNTYYSADGRYLYDAVNSVGYTFSNVSSFWGATGNEIPLNKLNGVYSPNYS